MGSENTSRLGIKLSHELMDKTEVLNSFCEHLILDFVKDLVWFVFPVHSRSYNKIIKAIAG